MTERRYNLRSLPGGRRGASGADAGCHRMRTIGGAELSRRASSEQSTTADDGELSRRALRDNATADDISTASPSAVSIASSGSSYRTPASPTTSTASTYLSVNVAQEALPADYFVPTTNKSQMRRRWTTEYNEFILRTYLQITLLEQDTSDYLTPLHSKFLERFPHVDVSRQRLGDQRRAIIRNKLLTQEKINTIYEEIKMELQTHNSEIQSHTIHQSTTTSPQHIQHSQPQRMRWTNDMNEDIIRSYYRVTELETNKTGYRKALHQDFLKIYPHLSSISEQRIADQRRRIFTNKVINADRLNNIRQEIADEIRLQTNNTANMPINNTQTDTQNNLGNNIDFIYNIDPELFTDTQHTQQLTDIQRIPEIDRTFLYMLRYFSNTQPTERPYIPKQKTSKKLSKVVQYINSIILPENINDSIDFKTFQMIVYCSAITAAKINGSKILIPPPEDTNLTRNHAKLGWQIRLENKINDLRAKIGRLTQYINGNTSSRLQKRVDDILEQYKVHSIHEGGNTEPIQVLDTLKQKLSVANSRLKRYNACTLRKNQNIQFRKNEKQFYRTIRNSNITHNNFCQSSQSTPPPNVLRNFWASIWEQPISHNDEADWIKNEENNNVNTPEMQFEVITVDTFHRVLCKQHNWKAPGSDHIHNYWYKKFTYIHPFLHNYINQFIQDPESLPQYITTGITYMLPKDTNDTLNPAKYRPITCLQTLYKIITPCLSELIYKHSTDNNILTEQQKGCRKFSQGCKEQLTIDSVILRQVFKKKKDIYSMYIDYKKAYDSVPHSWLLKILNIYKIHPRIINFLHNSVQKWTTRLKINTIDGTITTEPIQIQRGIFQGDALSPLWFCLALNPLSNILNSSKIGYPLNFNDIGSNTQTQTETINLNHLLYMDDIKLYASSEHNLNNLANTVENFSNDICMEFGIDKCKINSIKKGQQYQHNYEMASGEQIDSLDEHSAYKYLGYNQSKYIEYKESKIKLQQQFRSRLNAILKTHLNSRNMIKAINTFAIPILTYSFGIINWSKTELKNIQRSINVTMTKYRKHHPRSCLQRITLPRIDGGRGLIDINNLHNSQIVTLRQYFHHKAQTSILHNAIVQNDCKFTPLNLNNSTKQNNEYIKDKQTKIEEWTQKSLHGRHYQDLNHPNVDKTASNAWLRRGELFPETEGFMIAIQDQVIETRNYQKYITKTLASDICRRCNSAPETIQHITGACKTIVQTEYKHRHDQIANIIHQKLAQKYNLIPDTYTPYYKYVPYNVLENSKYRLYFDRAILTDRTTHYNRPDITLVDKDNKTALIIDIAIPNTHNLQSTIAEKLSKYLDLKEEITRMWHLQKLLYQSSSPLLVLYQNSSIDPSKR